MKMRLNIKLFLAMFFSILVPIFFCSFTLKVEAAEEKEKTLDILLKEDSDIEQVQEKILDINDEIQIELYEDINLLHIIYPESFPIEKIVQNKAINKEIDIVGELPKLEETKSILDDELLEKIIPESEEIASDSDSDVDFELFDLLAWHVDEVTEDRRSLDLTTGNGVRVAVIDSGVDITHPLLAGKIDLINGKSYVTDDDSIMDYNSHGTATAGIIAQIAPDTVITPYKVMGSVDGESIWTIAAILDAVNDGNDVINLSLGTYKCIDDSDQRILINTFKRAIRYAENNNVVIFASSGNKGINLDENYENNRILHLPGEIKGVNTISATWNELGTSYSNYGSCVDFSAPGGDLVYIDGYLDLSACMYIACPTYMNNGLEALGIPQGYTFSYGTSLSSAVAAACFADVYSYGKDNYPYFEKDDAIDLLIASSVDLGDEGKDIYYGNGEINIYKAISGIKPIYEGEVTDNDGNSRTYRNSNLTADYTITEEYGDTYHVNVILTNETSRVIHKWEIAMDFDDEIEQIWNGEYRNDGDYTIVSNMGYNQDIEVGESVSFGFIAKKKSENEIKLPNEILLVNKKNMIDPDTYGVNYEISSQWDDGLVANVTITNNSDQTITDWKMEFTYDADIESIWCAKIEDRDDNYYSIQNDGSNQNIPPGSSVTFGFKAVCDGEAAIDNVTIVSITR